MAEIEVANTGDETYRVVVTDGRGRTTHTVTATAAEITGYGGEADAERLIEASFEFLLARESKESILRSFDLPVIERYFPDYPAKIRALL